MKLQTLVYVLAITLAVGIESAEINFDEDRWAPLFVSFVATECFTKPFALAEVKL